MKYLKTYENERKVLDYVKIPYYEDEFEEFGNKIYQIKYMNHFLNITRDYLLVSVFDDKDPGWIPKSHVRDLLPEEEEELKIKLAAKKYNL